MSETNITPEKLAELQALCDAVPDENNYRCEVALADAARTAMPQLIARIEELEDVLNFGWPDRVVTHKLKKAIATIECKDAIIKDMYELVLVNEAPIPIDYFDDIIAKHEAPALSELEKRIAADLEWYMKDRTPALPIRCPKCQGSITINRESDLEFDNEALKSQLSKALDEKQAYYDIYGQAMKELAQLQADHKFTTELYVDATTELCALQAETLELKKAVISANMTSFGILEALDQDTIKALEDKDDN